MCSFDKRGMFPSTASSISTNSGGTQIEALLHLFDSSIRIWNIRLIVFFVGKSTLSPEMLNAMLISRWFNQKRMVDKSEVGSLRGYEMETLSETLTVTELLSMRIEVQIARSPHAANHHELHTLPKAHGPVLISDTLKKPPPNARPNISLSTSGGRRVLGIGCDTLASSA